MKIYVLLGHPDKESFNGQLFDRYVATAKKRGHEVRGQQLGAMHFDPVLWKGYGEKQELEPDLKTAQEHILWCDKWVLIYPMWWGSVPAILKGFFDRVLTPGFAFKYHEKDPFWDKLLKGRSYELINTCDAPKLWVWFQYRNGDFYTIKKATLEFCGLKKAKVWRLDKMKYKNEQDREKILLKIENSIK